MMAPANAGSRRRAEEEEAATPDLLQAEAVMASGTRLLTAIASVAASGGRCLRGRCDEPAAEITIVNSTMRAADELW